MSYDFKIAEIEGQRRRKEEERERAMGMAPGKMERPPRYPRTSFQLGWDIGQAIMGRYGTAPTRRPEVGGYGPKPSPLPPMSPAEQRTAETIGNIMAGTLPRNPPSVPCRKTSPAMSLNGLSSLAPDIGVSLRRVKSLKERAREWIDGALDGGSLDGIMELSIEEGMKLMEFLDDCILAAFRMEDPPSTQGKPPTGGSSVQKRADLQLVPPYWATAPPPELRC